MCPERALHGSSDLAAQLREFHFQFQVSVTDQRIRQRNDPHKKKRDVAFPPFSCVLRSQRRNIFILDHLFTAEFPCFCLKRFPYLGGSNH